MPHLTQARLKELLHYDPETGVFTWRVDRVAGEYRSVIMARAGDVANGYVRKSWRTAYRFLCVDAKKHRAHRLAWLYVHGVLPKQLDHKDGDGLNNRIDNLRPCSDSLNGANIGPKLSSKTGVKGVMYFKRDGNYHAQITKNRKRLHLGYFDTIEDAAAAYNQATIALNGEFARLA